MYARVWQLRIRPGRTEEFKATLDSLHPTAERQPGYRGFVALGSSKEKAPEVTVISLWDSLEAMRESERNMFLMQAISRLLGCCKEVAGKLEACLARLQGELFQLRNGARFLQSSRPVVANYPKFIDSRG